MMKRLQRLRIWLGLGAPHLALGLGSIVLFGAQAEVAENTRLEFYPDAPGQTTESRAELRVRERPVRLVGRRVWHMDSSGKHFIEVASARFAADGPVRIALRADERRFGQPQVRACGRDLGSEQIAGGLACELPGPGQYYVQLPGLARSNGTFTVVIWLDDLRRLEQAREDLRNRHALQVTDAGVRSDPEADQTRAVQKLLDRGGTLCFPAGVYRTGSLRLRSDTTLWLAPGAVLRAVDQEDAVGPEYIAIENARNVRVCGPGTLDANSLARRRGHNVHHVNITSSRDVTFEDVLFEESNSWAIHIRKSERFTARNVKVFSGKDGFDPDSSRDVLIDGAFVASADDAIAVKNRFPQDPDGKTTERVVFTNSIVTTTKSALKIGTETTGPIRDVLFQNCDVFDGERGIVLYARDGGPIERVVWRDLRLFMVDWPQEKESGSVIHATVERRAAPTPVRDCLVENVSANWLFRSEFSGLAEAPLEGLKLRKIQVRVDPPREGRPFLFECGPHVQVRVEGLKVDWQGNRNSWAGTASGNGILIVEPGPAGPH